MTEHNELLVPLVTLAIVPLFLAVLRPLAEKIALVDRPDHHRKRPNGAVPLTGGLAILLTLITAFTISNITANDLGMSQPFLFTMGILLALVVIAHAIDDILELNASTRLIIDGTLAWLIASVAMVQIITLGELFGMGEVTLGRFAIPMTIFSFIAASNAFNMTDGIDSQCTGFGLVAFASLIVFLLTSANPAATPLINVLVIITAALVPMYLANIGKLGPYLRAFLGDSGARLIGFLAATTVILAAAEGFIDPVYAFFPIAIPVCDCLVLMAVRVSHGRSPVSADRRHLHHLLMDSGLSASQARLIGVSLGITYTLIGVSLHTAAVHEVIVSAVVVTLFASFIALRTILAIKARSRGPTLGPSFGSEPTLAPGQEDPTITQSPSATLVPPRDEGIPANASNHS